MMFRFRNHAKQQGARREKIGLLATSAAETAPKDLPVETSSSEASSEKELSGETVSVEPSPVQDLPAEETAPAAENGSSEALPAQDLPAVETAPAAENGSSEALPAQDLPAVETAPAAENASGPFPENAPAEQAGSGAEAAQAPARAPADPAAPGLKPEPAAVRDPLDLLEPAAVFAYFRAISAIPHGSFHTGALSDYLEAFAAENGLPCVRDEMGNLIISRPASAGCEDAPPLALQGHIDMVCEKEPDQDIDMEREAITLVTDGEWLRADRTTLGGDDGIAVAFMMAVLTDDSLVCPPIECIFTVDEEVGLRGADAIDLSFLKSRRMLNLDSDTEGILTVGCAGGVEAVCTLDGSRREKKGSILVITVDSLRGGHSAEKINAGHANAVLLLSRLLYRLERVGKYSLVSINGGKRNNVIPREARAEIVFTGNISRSDVKKAVALYAEEIAKEYRITDPEIRIRASWNGKEKRERCIAFTRSDSRRMVRFLMALPNGVIEDLYPERKIPRTSLNLGVVRSMADGLSASSFIRSSLESRKQMVVDRISCIADQFEAMVQTGENYPAWERREKSALCRLAADLYFEMTGKKAKISVTHGGLECGLIAAKVPGLDCISIGPDMEAIHTPSERLNIPSCARTWDYLRQLIAACAQQK